jgi:ferritin-like metal-binding protein YciE
VGAAGALLKEFVMADLSARDAKLVQFLNEAYGLESRLQTALEAHLAMTVDAAYKKRLKQHLSETKRHARDVKKRVKQLGGKASTVDAPGPAPVAEAAQAVLGGAQKAAALAQGPIHALRGTGEWEKQLKNAKTEYASEAEEIATYTAIATLAAAIGDRETQRLARAILREEERMRSYLEKVIPRLTKAVVKAEIPAAQRGSARRAKKTPSVKPAATKRAAVAKGPAKRATAKASTKRATAKASTKRAAVKAPAKRAIRKAKPAGASKSKAARKA